MPSFRGRRNGARRRKAAAAAEEEEERLSRSSSGYSSNDETSEREKNQETIRRTLNPYNDASNTYQSQALARGFMRRPTRSKGSKKRRGRGKKTARRSRRH
jgi:hypothetical protein